MTDEQKLELANKVLAQRDARKAKDKVYNQAQKLLIQEMKRLILENDLVDQLDESVRKYIK